MPDPVSDAYGPEFGSAENADALRRAAAEVRAVLNRYIADADPILKRVELVALARSQDANAIGVALTARELRILRFCVDRALESL